MLPGPPRELIPMFQNEVMPYLSKFSDGSIVSRTIQVMGIGESKVEEMLRRGKGLTQFNLMEKDYATFTAAAEEAGLLYLIFLRTLKKLRIL